MRVMTVYPRWSGAVAVTAAWLLALSACDETPGGGDGGVRRDGQISGTCNVDRSVDIDTAIELELGEEVTGYICPRGDIDFYKITVPASDSLLRVRLIRAAAVSNVQLHYLLLKRQQPGADGVKERTVAVAPPSDGRKIDALHCLDPGEPDLEPGVYYVMVQDNGNDAEDRLNPYQLTVTSDKDPDINEPNDSFDQARPLSGPATGYISCVGDVDYFSLTVGADQLLEVSLKTANATPVDIKYTIYGEDRTEISTAEHPDGTKGAADLLALHAVPRAGKYYIKVEDAGNDEGDPKTAYTLSATTKPELDEHDKGTRNDTPATATRVPLGTRTFTGQIGSLWDVDYYVIEGLEAVSPTNPAVMEVTLGYSEKVPVDPTFAYIYPARSSPCTKDACCRVLDPEGPGCTNFLDCMRQSYSCIDKGDTFCTDQDCSPNAGINCVTERRCAGAAVCLPGLNVCGAESVVRWAMDGGKITTSQLLIHPGPWYVRVSDLKSDDYAYGKNYTLTIKTRMDPDGAAEPDNELFPDLCQLTLLGPDENGWDMHYAIGKNKARSIDWGQPVTGYLSYEGDIDFYRLPNPCPGADCILRIDFSTGPNCPTSGAPRRSCEDPNKNTDSLGLEFLYTLRRSNGRAWTAFKTKPGESGCWGDCPSNAKCFYSYANHGSDSYLFTVEDYNYNSWSWDCSYTFTLSKTQDGCQPPCTTHPESGNCTRP